MPKKKQSVWWPSIKKVDVVCDYNHWMHPWAHRLTTLLESMGHTAYIESTPLSTGDICVLMGYDKILSKKELSAYKHTILVHASNLPEGRGWSPWVWQILSGDNNLTLSLIEAAPEVDTGKIYCTSYIYLRGNELIDEIRDKIGLSSMQLVLNWLVGPVPTGWDQKSGGESYYDKRTPENSELDPKRSLASQFDLLRVVDNEKWPAFFKHKGRTYTLRITHNE